MKAIDRQPRAAWSWSFFLPENMPEDKAHKGTCVKNLPEKRHGKIKSGSLKPYRNKAGARMFKEQNSQQAHKRAHPCNGKSGNRKNKMKRIFSFRIYKAQGCSLGNPSYQEKVQEKGGRSHNEKFMKGCGKNAGTQSAGFQRYVVAEHGIDHNDNHQDGKDDFLKLCFGHKKTS